MEGEHEYGFWHVLVRDVCYGQIPRAARAARHLAAAFLAHLTCCEPLARQTTAALHGKLSPGMAVGRAQLGGIAAAPEVLAEEVVAPRPVRQRPAALRRLARRLNRVEDPPVSGAAADVAVERLRAPRVSASRPVHQGSTGDSGRRQDEFKCRPCF